MIKCNALTNGLTILPSGKVVPCCNFDYSRAEEVTDRKTQFSSIKESFAQDIKHPACNKCWQSEDYKMGSLRTSFYNSNYKTPDNVDDVVFLDIRNNNLCNLTCRMCGPMFSSKIGKAVGLTEYLVHAPLSNYQSQINLSAVQDIYFTGGEPFLNIDHWSLLDSIPDPIQVGLRYNSNLTLLSYKDKHIFDYWPKFKKIWFQTSIEGIGDYNDLIRVGSNWVNIENNLQQLYKYRREHNNLTLGVATCLSILNVWDIKQIIQYSAANNLDLHLIHLTGPMEFSLSTLPADKKIIVKQLILDVAETATLVMKHKLMVSIDKMMSTDTSHLFTNCILEIKKHDGRYGSNLFDKIKHNLL